MNDPIIDLIIHIKNGYMARKESVVMPHSSYRQVVAEKLKSLGYLKDVVVEGSTKKTVFITLLYQEGEPAITDVQIHSKPGKRMYVSYKKLKSVLSGIGHSILSTPKGILTEKEAKQKKLGGELLFSFW